MLLIGWSIAVGMAAHALHWWAMSTWHLASGRAGVLPAPVLS